MMPRFGNRSGREGICACLMATTNVCSESEPERGMSLFSVIRYRAATIQTSDAVAGDKIQVTYGQSAFNGTCGPSCVMRGVFRKEVMDRQGPQVCVHAVENGCGRCRLECVKRTAQIGSFANGVEHPILNIGNQASDNTSCIRAGRALLFPNGGRGGGIPPRPPGGKILISGRVSRLAQQARWRGFCPFENLIGRADRIMFSSGGAVPCCFFSGRGVAIRFL